MRRKNMKKTAALFLLSVGVNCMTAQDIVPVHEFDIDIQKVGSPIQSTMYGIFFEDINFGADGGLYAELIKNRSFEFENPWGGWEPFGDVSIAEKNPCFNKNPHYAHLTYTGQITGTGLENEGFKGIGIKADENYDFSLYARTETNNPIKLRIELVNRDNDIYETQHLEIKGKDWKKYSVILSPKATEAHDGNGRYFGYGTYLPFPGKNIQQSHERPTLRSGTSVERSKAGNLSFPGWMYR